MLVASPEMLVDVCITFVLLLVMVDIILFGTVSPEPRCWRRLGVGPRQRGVCEGERKRQTAAVMSLFVELATCFSILRVFDAIRIL